MGVVELDCVVVIAPVDVVDSAVDSGRIDPEALGVLDDVVAAGPRPDSIGRADGLALLKAGAPRGALLDPAVLGGEKNDAVAIHVVNDRIADYDVAGEICSRLFHAADCEAPDAVSAPDAQST